VKPKYLFLLKFLGISLLLFIFSHTILYGYALVLGYIITFFNPQYRVPSDIVGFIYISSITMLAFIALILSTPKVPIEKKAGFILIGMLVYMIIDFYGVQHIIFPQGTPPLDEDSFLRELYLSSKWILPFLLWIVMSYSYFGNFFRQTTEVSSMAD